MTENKRTAEEYLDGLRKSDHEQILYCLTDDISGKCRRVSLDWDTASKL